jgi:hypothetical protein
MAWFGPSKNTKLRLQARKDYETALEQSQKTSRSARVLCVRMAFRCRAHVDAAFVQAALATEAHEAALTAALAGGKDAPELTEASPWQLVKSGQGHMYTYIPESYAVRVFSLGALYQTLKISREQATAKAQEILNEICEELGVLEQFDALRFLQDGADGDDDQASEPLDGPQ